MKEYLPYVTVLGSVFAFCFTAFKYLHTQKIAQRNKRFEQFNKVFEWVSGRTADGVVLVNTQQAIAIYQLGEFPEYKHMSLPILEYYIKQVSAEPENELLKSALINTKSKLEGQA